MRYYCHHCERHISADELLPEFTCPSCHSGFVEEIGSSATTRRTSSADAESNRPSLDDAMAGFISTRMSSDEYSDNDNSDVEFLDTVHGPLAQVFGLFQPTQQQSNPTITPNTATDSTAATGATTTATTTNVGQSSQSDSAASNNTTITPQSNRRITRSTARLNQNPGQMHSAGYSSNNQSLADVLNDFITGVSFGTQYPEGTTTSNSQNHGASGSTPIGANRGLINIDFPLPFFLHSNPGDYAWGNAGFDAVITQLLNNLDGSNSGPPPMPKDQVDNLPTVKISDEQVKGVNLQCTVCMDDFQVGDSARQLPCEHFFHQDCIVPWLNLVSIPCYI